ncbi:uncharacterized protein PF3D7_1120000-like [Macrobrachium rosenbergii]|uniref:uncharacterized protein PF3D7_1120000-like n=1 Tax=Macrobrachium rosenbergii TaxID=79674 RepID=UPI0034D6A56D
MALKVATQEKERDFSVKADDISDLTEERASLEEDAKRKSDSKTKVDDEEFSKELGDGDTQPKAHILKRPEDDDGETNGSRRGNSKTERGSRTTSEAVLLTQDSETDVQDHESGSPYTDSECRRVVCESETSETEYERVREELLEELEIPMEETKEASVEELEELLEEIEEVLKEEIEKAAEEETDDLLEIIE